MVMARLDRGEWTILTRSADVSRSQSLTLSSHECNYLHTYVLFASPIAGVFQTDSAHLQAPGRFGAVPQYDGRRRNALRWISVEQRILYCFENE